MKVETVLTNHLQNRKTNVNGQKSLGLQNCARDISTMSEEGITDGNFMCPEGDLQ